MGDWGIGIGILGSGGINSAQIVHVSRQINSAANGYHENQNTKPKVHTNKSPNILISNPYSPN